MKAILEIKIDVSLDYVEQVFRNDFSIYGYTLDRDNSRAVKTVEVSYESEIGDILHVWPYSCEVTRKVYEVLSDTMVYYLKILNKENG